MNVLVINCGSSSLKYQLFNMKDESVLAKGLVERIGIDGSKIKHETTGKDKKTIETPMKDHKDALKIVLDSLIDAEYGAIKSLNEIDAAGHRVVHGGEFYSESVIIDEEVMNAIEECCQLAPLHNPPNITGINAIKELLPNIKNVAVFDTAFHQTMEPTAYIYPLPYEYYEKYKVRRYGFHGSSHRYVAQRAAEIVGKPVEDLKIISCHLGNGASVTAIKGGKSVSTSMGFTPLEGLVMGTRCGDVDPAIITYIMEKENLDIHQMNDIMNKKSGVLGISGLSSDFRDVEDAAAIGDKRAQLAIDIFDNRVKRYIAAYAADLGGVDVLVFTAGLGENSAMNRSSICHNLDFMGVKFCADLNAVRGKEAIISDEDSLVKVIVIPTNEELVIARDTVLLTK